MKKIIAFAAIAAAAVLTASCSKEQTSINVASNGMRTLTFTGINENNLKGKTFIGEDGVAVNWCLDDSLYIFYHENDGIRVGNSIAHIKSIDEETGAATFNVSVPEDAVLDIMYACYNPADRDPSQLWQRNPLTLNPKKSDDGICTYARAEFMTRQIARKNSYDSASASMVARWINDGSDQPVFDFYNLGSFVGFDFENTSSYQIDSVELSFGGSFFRYYYGFNAEDDINIYTTSGKYTAVMLVGPFESGNKYYIAMTPNTNFTNPKMKFYVHDWGTLEKTNSTTIKLARNQVMNIGKFAFDNSSFPSTLEIDKSDTETLVGTSLTFTVTSANVDWTATITKDGVAAGTLDVTEGTSGATKVTATLPVNLTDADAEYVVTVKSGNPLVEDKSFKICQLQAVPFGTSLTKTWFSAWRKAYTAAGTPYHANGVYVTTTVSTGQLYSSGKFKGKGTFQFTAKTAGKAILDVYIQKGSVTVSKNGAQVEVISTTAGSPEKCSTAPFDVAVGDVISLNQTASNGFIGFLDDTVGIFYNAATE